MSLSVVTRPCQCPSFHTLADFVLHQHERFRTNPARSQDSQLDVQSWNWKRKPPSNSTAMASFPAQEDNQYTTTRWTTIELNLRRAGES